MATIKKRGDLAIGNLIGSNIFNIVGILGVAGLIRPLPVQRAVLTVDIPWLLGISVFLLVIILSRPKITRLVGISLLLTYSVYALTLFR
jgi:cation:H+ antiporter